MRVSLGELVCRKVCRYFDEVAFASPQTSLFYSGEWVLVTAAAGGIGMSAVQIAKGMYRISCDPTEPCH